MNKLALMLYPIISSVVMGLFFLPTVLVEALYNGPTMIVAAIVGAVAAVPLTMRVAKALGERTRPA